MIISQNNNIPRIKGIISRLCRSFGEPVGEDWAFPGPERLAELMETLRRYRLEPKTLRFVQKNGTSAPSLVLLGCRKDGRTGLTVQPPLLLQNADGTETEELRRIYFRDKG